ncbi:hypothetical protein EfmAA94_06820 [Enterococcus faecium]|nr:hypothetical protein EfmAA94_06820 [Enterococcus faecium]
MEYDSDRAGDFTPLRHWSNKESKVVLGLVTYPMRRKVDRKWFKRGFGWCKKLEVDCRKWP